MPTTISNKRHEFFVIETNQQARTLPVLTSKLSKSKYHLALRCTSTSLPLLHGPSTLQKFTSFGPLNFCNQQACVLPKHFSLLFPLATIECPLISFSNRHCSSKKAHAIAQRDHLVMSDPTPPSPQSWEVLNSWCPGASKIGIATQNKTQCEKNHQEKRNHTKKKCRPQFQTSDMKHIQKTVQILSVRSSDKRLFSFHRPKHGATKWFSNRDQVDSDFVVSGWPQLSRGLKQFGKAVGAGAVSLCQMRCFFKGSSRLGWNVWGGFVGVFFKRQFCVRTC